jgi:hypothetical protein
MPTVSAKLNESDLVALNRYLESNDYTTLDEFLRDVSRHDLKVNLLVDLGMRWAGLSSSLLPFEPASTAWQSITNLNMSAILILGYLALNSSTSAFGSVTVV